MTTHYPQGKKAANAPYYIEEDGKFFTLYSKLAELLGYLTQIGMYDSMKEAEDGWKRWKAKFATTAKLQDYIDNRKPANTKWHVYKALKVFDDGVKLDCKHEYVRGECKLCGKGQQETAAAKPTPALLKALTELTRPIIQKQMKGYTLKNFKVVYDSRHVFWITFETDKDFLDSEDRKSPLYKFGSWEDKPGDWMDPLQADGGKYIIGDGDDGNAVETDGRKLKIWLRRFDDAGESLVEESAVKPTYLERAMARLEDDRKEKASTEVIVPPEVCEEEAADPQSTFVAAEDDISTAPVTPQQESQLEHVQASYVTNALERLETAGRKKAPKSPARDPNYRGADDMGESDNDDAFLNAIKAFTKTPAGTELVTAFNTEDEAGFNKGWKALEKRMREFLE